ALAPVTGTVPLNFKAIPVLAVGNEHLDVEEVKSGEIGYALSLGAHVFVQMDYYRNRYATFTSGLLPQVGTSLGRLNPSFGPYRAPAELSAAAAAAVQVAVHAALPAALAPALSNLPAGRPVV